MTQITYRANLATAEFPLLSEQQGRTVIIGGPDQQYVPNQGTSDITNKVGIPQIYYGHNIMPTAVGWQSIGFKQRVRSKPGIIIKATVLIENSDLDWPIILGIDATSGKIYTRYPTVITPDPDWALIKDLADKNTTVSSAFINGVTYVCFGELLGAYYYDLGTNTIIHQVLAGLASPTVRGVLASSGYMIVWDHNKGIYWSSQVDPTDFVPSLITGAGGGQVQECKGSIRFCIPVDGGFIIYTDKNQVGATYSGNARYPFIFKEISGGGGLHTNSIFGANANDQYKNHVSVGEHGDNAIAFTTNGLQRSTLKSAESFLPEISDFISGNVVEDFNESTLMFSKNYKIGYATAKKITLIASRYLVVSYKFAEYDSIPLVFTHALIYDLGLNKLGKVKIDHTDCFEFTTVDVYPGTPNSDLPRNSIAFCTFEGAIYTIDFDTNAANSNGVLFLGKLQYIRSAMMDLQEVCIENIHQQGAFQLYDFPTIDGNIFIAPVPEYIASSSAKQRVSNFDVSGMNHSLLFKGAFDLNSVIATFVASGRR